MDRKNMLEFMLNTRLEEVAILTEYDLIELNTYMKDSEIFEETQIFINSLPLPIELRNKLSDMLFEVESSGSETLGYYNIKYYKAGFSDAVNLIFDAKENKPSQALCL